MILKNLFRRKGRTFLTLVGIAIGVAAIIALGAMAAGMREGYNAMASGSEADLVLTQESAMDVTMGGLEESVGNQLLGWPEVDEIDASLVGNVQAEDLPYFYIFGYDPEGFAITHFRVVEGQTLKDVKRVRGKPLLLGRAAADSMEKEVGDTLRITGGAFRIVGIYETGSAFEDGGAVIPLDEAQSLMLQPHRVSMYYLRLRSPEDEARFRTRVDRYLDDVTLSTTSEFADRQEMVEYMQAFAWGIAAIAILIGGLVMTNTLFMSAFERTREIGLLRALGWRRGQVMRLILGESLVLALFGGVIGIILGVVLVSSISSSSAGGFLTMAGTHFTADLFLRALVVVVLLGLVGGAFPAWWASRLLPLEALNYEGGGGSDPPRFLPGGLTLRNLWRRRTRTLLTVLGIGVGIAAIVSLQGIMGGMADSFTDIAMGGEIDLMALEADASDMGYSTIDERVGARLASLPEIEAAAGMGVAFTSTEEVPIFLMWGYNPREFAINHFKIVEGEPLATNRQMLLGRQAAENMGVEVGDTLRMLDSSFRVVGIYETGVSFEEVGGVITLRDAQRLAGRPHQVTLYGIKLRDPKQAEEVKAYLDANFPEIDVSLTSEFSENIPDLQASEQMVGQIAFLAILIGGVGMLNTMLMSVLERTREIGVLRALGWRRRQVVGVILREALVLGLIGGICGILLGLGLAWLLGLIPMIKGMVVPVYTAGLFALALAVALVTGVVGALYPSWRATRMQPVEALRYE
jgi:ABC-type antimicrobial peptide transport system permease subunit